MHTQTPRRSISGTPSLLNPPLKVNSAYFQSEIYYFPLQSWLGHVFCLFCPRVFVYRLAGYLEELALLITLCQVQSRAGQISEIFT